MHIRHFLESLYAYTCTSFSLWCIATLPEYAVVQAIVHRPQAFAAHGVSYLAADEVGQDELYRHVTTPFLGQRYVYIIRGLSTLDKRSQQSILDMLCSAKLQHAVILFSDQYALIQEHISTSDAAVAVYAHHISPSAFRRIYWLLFCHTFPQAYVQRIYAMYSRLSFTLAYTIMWYYYVLGKNIVRWEASWLPRICDTQIPFSRLTHYFFYKNMTKFWFTWHEIRNAYAPEFWIAFWAEQLWQAYTFLYLAHQRTASYARSHTQRLPYSFTQSGWRHVTMNELACALACVYEIDLHIKRGGTSTMPFEVFFVTWFSGSFFSKSLWSDNSP